ncbi:hypothetical protein PENNAL_c0268G06926 [Penicillium nalgiovense]|uniref:Uncharacterized protein n=1 Tax=Penicillium nalgiovense TaxID=60175 RepID=A0A1V6WHE0_PENNA|nr:hypothetical protein PENNAL_c0268G06926 [Penicillium nalgiovense]
MDSQNSSPEQEKEGEQQPSELPILSDNDDSQVTSDNAPPLRSPSQHEEETRHTLATGPFQAVLKVIADLERDDPKSAFPAARLVGLYRRLWESINLSKERDSLQLHHEKQLVRLRFFGQALESSRERLIVLLDDWNYPFSPNLTGLTDVARGD